MNTKTPPGAFTTSSSAGVSVTTSSRNSGGASNSSSRDDSFFAIRTPLPLHVDITRNGLERVRGVLGRGGHGESFLPWSQHKGSLIFSDPRMDEVRGRSRDSANRSRYEDDLAMSSVEIPVVGLAQSSIRRSHRAHQLHPFLPTRPCGRRRRDRLGCAPRASVGGAGRACGRWSRRSRAPRRSRDLSLRGR